MSSENAPIAATGQYSTESLRRYEWIFGKDFLSSGALETAHEAARALGLGEGCRVLDVGSGLGGTALLFAEEYSATVTGLDVLPQMVAQARKRAVARGGGRVEFVHGDILTAPVRAESFDAVFSKDSFLHVHDKPRLMKKLFTLLAPGGRIHFTDYLRAKARGGDEFEEYVAGSSYTLATPEEYETCMGEAGFEGFSFVDRSHRLIEILQADINRMETAKGDEHGPGKRDIEYLRDRWLLKIRCLRGGDMKWGSFTARRPAG